MTEDERKAEIERLQSMLEASSRMGTGFAGRMRSIEKRLAELKQGA